MVMAFSLPRRLPEAGTLLTVCLAHAAVLWWLDRAGPAQPPAQPQRAPRVVGRLVADDTPAARQAIAPRPAPPQPRPARRMQPMPPRPRTAFPRSDTAPASRPALPSQPAAPAGSPGPKPVSEAGPRAEDGPVQLPLSRASGLDNPLPVYPELSRRLGEEGVVRLAVLILADGRVAEVSVARSSGFPRLDAAAVAAVRRWHYLPARRNGEPVAWRHTQPVAFSLND